MANEIDLEILRRAVNNVLDHLTEDLGMKTIPIEEAADFYWDCPPPKRYDASKKPSDYWAGRLSDDVDFIGSIQRGQAGDWSINLVHVAPLLLYIGEKIQS